MAPRRSLTPGLGKKPLRWPALREQLSIREVSAGAAIGIAPADVPFNIPGPSLAGMVPTGGDWFTTTNNPTGWTVVSVQYDILTQQYRVIGRARR